MPEHPNTLQGKVLTFRQVDAAEILEHQVNAGTAGQCYLAQCSLVWYYSFAPAPQGPTS